MLNIDKRKGLTTDNIYDWNTIVINMFLVLLLLSQSLAELCKCGTQICIGDLKKSKTGFTSVFEIIGTNRGNSY